MIIAMDVERDSDRSWPEGTFLKEWSSPCSDQEDTNSLLKQSDINDAVEQEHSSDAPVIHQEVDFPYPW